AGPVRPLHLLVPAGFDDPARPSGGNAYDLGVRAELQRLGHEVTTLAAPGSWPRPDAGDLAALAAALDGVPDGGVVLADGLVACAAPDVVERVSRRLRVVVLVHLPLADETGLAPDVAAALDA